MDSSKRMRRTGRRLLGLMWLPFIGIFIGMIGMPNGSYSWSELPALSRYSLLAMAVCGGGAMICLIGSGMTASTRSQRVLAEGVPAQAIVLKLTDTGTTVNRNPLARLTLEVHSPNEAPFEAEMEKVLSRLEVPQFQPGAILNVKYDPDSKAVAVLSVDGLAEATVPATSPPEVA